VGVEDLRGTLLFPKYRLLLLESLLEQQLELKVLRKSHLLKLDLKEVLNLIEDPSDRMHYSLLPMDQDMMLRQKFLDRMSLQSMDLKVVLEDIQQSPF
jgi:hypothetical protein